MLDLHPELKARPFLWGMAVLLRELVSWVPEPKGDKGFVLAHPDFDIQNVIVWEEGELRGLIDWDGVAALPRSLGNERYPGWLTRDLVQPSTAIRNPWTKEWSQKACGRTHQSNSPTTVRFITTLYNKVGWRWRHTRHRLDSYLFDYRQLSYCYTRSTVPEGNPRERYP
jgi:hypothetical protein